MARSRGIPVLVREGAAFPLTPAPLGQHQHDEAWLQALVHAHPQILPVAEIEPGFGELIAAAREVPCGHGFIDNLFVTPAGDIVIAEVKLWRNPEMRRKVVAQALDYVAALGRMGFEAFESAVARGEGASKRLYDLVRGHPDAPDEAGFIDAVSRNLRRGRMLVMVVGDGIRAETEALAGLLQGHAGAHFTFALIELSLWTTGSGDILAVPHTLAKTVTIERGVVRISDAGPIVEPVPAEAQAGPQSLSLAAFWEELGKRDPALPGAVRGLLAALEPLGVYPDLKASLNLKVDLPDREKPVSFGYITRDGLFDTFTLAPSVPEDVWRPYLETLARLVNGTVIDEPKVRRVAVNGRAYPRIGQLLPQHQAALVGAIETALRALRAEEA